MTDKSFDLRIDMVDVKGTAVAVLSGLPSVHEIDEHPNLLEHIADALDELLKTGQRMGIVQTDPYPAMLTSAYMKMQPVTFGEKVKYLRQRDKLTQKEAAAKFSILSERKTSQSNWSEWERKQYAVRGNVVEMLCRMFEVRASFFYET